ncbi:NH(3)-dependent NAD(+) synthetase [Spiroplasma sabaudiense Ar-1343]|uniref:NH(3)-dependent NAD(+) synthetase n=1 Tax=Spiroplasma sabaudiense Ar-1343 TaxID=1276257 RepID=W6AJ22_9MOLU|nr:NAD(+) synthase [Spiroplasma sabaudiense]AHI53694.1 NH(3)-dependent NAD(+) synthetase [Spiroplasma sabaudiense Ar-1343]
MKIKEYVNLLVDFIKTETLKAKADGVIVGISGGIDSAVVSLLAKKAFPDNYLTVWMPINSSAEDLKCVNELISDFKLNHVEVNLKPTFESLSNAIQDTNINCTDLSLANTKARLRMTTLYNLAQTKNYLVLGTDNAVEWHIGYFTKFGDGGCDLLPLVHLLKGEVKEMAKELGVPKSIIDRDPTASLWEGQTDEKEIGFSYSEIDDYLRGNNSNQAVKDRIDYLHQISEHKRRGANQPLKFKGE